MGESWKEHEKSVKAVAAWREQSREILRREIRVTQVSCVVVSLVVTTVVGIQTGFTLMEAGITALCAYAVGSALGWFALYVHLEKYT